MKYISQVLAVLLFIAIVGLAPSIIRNSKEIQVDKKDLGELNHIYYGLFSVNAWKGQLSEIIFAEIQRLDIKSTAGQMRGTVENQLNVVIDKLNERIKESNRDSLGGKIKQILINIVVDIEEIKKGVPGYADALIKEMTNPETEKRVKDLATKQLKAYFNKTFEKQNTTLRDAAIARSGASNLEEAKLKLAIDVSEGKRKIFSQVMALISLSIVLFLLVGFTRKRTGVHYTALVLTLFTLMVIGVATPMIDLEAKISEMSFKLLGYNIVFENQILYFQSKSVLDVFEIMVTHPDLLMKFVGILMITFSVIFPSIKLISSLLYHFKVKGFRKNRFVHFFVFKSGKWSMADVLVVAIFMAYIGFSGIVSSQFSKIQTLVPEEMVFITTNGTALQPGFYAFLAYAILALVLSSLLDRSKADSRPEMSPTEQ